MKNIWTLLKGIEPDPISKIGERSIRNLSGFIFGYLNATSNEEQEDMRAFDAWIKSRMKSFLDTEGYSRIIELNSKDQSEAYDNFFILAKLYRKDNSSRDKVINWMQLKQINLEDFIESIVSRPKIYIVYPIASYLFAVINGFISGQAYYEPNLSLESTERMKGFNSFVLNKYSIKNETYTWYKTIEYFANPFDQNINTCLSLIKEYFKIK